MDTVLNLYKRKSETPLQTTERFVQARPEYSGQKMTYAGRLDPMAEGVLVVLVGDKAKERDSYTGLDKDYEFELVFGVETDTLDTLGLITASREAKPLPTLDEVNAALRKYVGTFEQQYPAYSSKVVNGVSLFEYARRGTISTITIPKHEVTVSKLEATGASDVSREELGQKILSSIAAVRGDFRQGHIVEAWEGYLTKSAPATFKVYRLSVSCGSGFYVRQLVSDLGKDFGLGAVTLSIVRTRVGSYSLADSIR